MAPQTALMTVTGGSGAPTLDEAAAQLGVASSALVRGFGVVPIDPDRHLYAVEVRSDAVPEATPGEPYRGPFSNPRIEPFGPIRVPEPND